MKATVDKILQQYGSLLRLRCSGQIRVVRGFFQSVNSKSLQSIEDRAMPLGEISRGQYTYVGPADCPVREGDLLEIQGKQYIFRRVEPYYHGDETVYIWGLCVEKGEDAVWTTQS